MRKQALFIAGMAVLLLVGAGCAKQASAPVAQGDQASDDAMMKKELSQLRVGVMVPQSGDAASYGESVKRGVQLAKKELGAEHVVFEFEDSKCDGKEAVSSINRLISAINVTAVIGELCSSATLPAAPIAEENQVVMISPASTAPTLTEAGDFIFRTVPSDALQGTFGAQLVYDKGHRKLAVLYVNDDYGVGFDGVLKKEFPALGGEIVASEAVARQSADVRTQLTKIKNANPEAIYLISNSPDTGVTALKQIKELGIEVTVFASEGLKSDDITSAAGDAAEGMIVSSVSSGSADFSNSHAGEYGVEPGPFAAQAYDAVKALVLASQTGATTGSEIRDALYDLSFEGASGYIDFDQNGDITGNYEVFVVQDGKFVRSK